MSAKRWLCIFVVSAIVVAALFSGFNALVDPFGGFGDKVLHWWSYDMTQNPRTAKIGWLDEHHADYDSYIIGSSKTSSIPTELLNAYYDADFYNILMYGGDMYDSEMTVKYILAHYGAKNIVINISLSELTAFNAEDDPIKGNLHAKVDGSNLPAFYCKYLFAHPQYAVDKLKAYAQDSYLVNANKVFVPETGAYDKSLRDVEPIGSLADYLEKYPEFEVRNPADETLPAVEECLASIARMQQMCAEAGVSVTFLISPMYDGEMDIYCNDDLFAFFEQLADITDYWDFSGYHSVSSEPRYFYDTMHYRNSVGGMMLARMFQNPDVYVPDDFGVYVTRETVAAHNAAYCGGTAAALENNNDVALPVLMYHNVTETCESVFDITPELFRAQMTALRDGGYHAVTFAQVLAYVEQGTPLPENPIVISFDDGYEGNLTLAAPILEELGMCAEINVIGVSIGKDSYKDTGVSMVPHFSLEEALPWVERGVIEIGSHSYDMHQVAERDGADCREGVYMLDGEREDDYIAAFRADTQTSVEEIERTLGTAVTVYAYPYGFYTDLTEVLLSEMGISVTLTVDEGINTVVEGLPQSLRAMKRCNISSEITPEEIVNYLKGMS
ncbi:MAG: polysaccharide deacetylase family protein [Oscillospiraceae bacterium]|nr:polysaccharide deacetylase family protein [Oscillospiraceae bacterium]